MNKTLQIQAIGLSLYEPVDGLTVEQIGDKVIRTQWLYVQNHWLGQTLKAGSGPNSGKLLLGKRILIVVSRCESDLT